MRGLPPIGVGAPPFESPEVFPSGGLQGARFAIGGGKFYLLPTQDLADAGDGHAGNLLRNAALGMSGEEQLVFVAAMQRQGQTSLAAATGRASA